jgi:succinyl-CoA synthetase alpha subunit
MSVLVNKNSKVIVQGFTGKEGSYHAEQMIAYGTQLGWWCNPRQRRSATFGQASF